MPDKFLDRQAKDFQTRRLMLDFLRRNKGKFFKAIKIAEIFSLPKTSTQVQARLLITQLIEIDNQPIIATNKGFAYTDDPKQIFEYMNNLEQRKKGIVRRIEKLSSIYSKMDKNKAEDLRAYLSPKGE